MNGAGANQKQGRASLKVVHHRGQLLALRLWNRENCSSQKTSVLSSHNDNIRRMHCTYDIIRTAMKNKTRQSEMTDPRSL